MMVKICGITNRDDAFAAVDGGASALGFNFYAGSPRYIAPDDAARVIDELPATVWKVGVFVDEPSEYCAATARRIGLDVVQLHGNETEFPKEVRVWKAARVGDGFNLADLDGLAVEAVLLDAPSETQFGGTGRTFDWSVAAGARGKIILAGGLDGSNVGRAIEVSRPWGVDACSRIESAPGRKDHEKMAKFLKAALQA